MAVTRNARSLKDLDGLGNAAHAIGAGRPEQATGDGHGPGRRKTMLSASLHTSRLAEKVGRSARRVKRA